MSADLKKLIEDVVGHHAWGCFAYYDYSKPLEVDWLCVRCHENRHHNVA